MLEESSSAMGSSITGHDLIILLVGKTYKFTHIDLMLEKKCFVGIVTFVDVFPGSLKQAFKYI